MIFGSLLSLLRASEFNWSDFIHGGWLYKRPLVNMQLHLGEPPIDIGWFPLVRNHPNWSGVDSNENPKQIYILIKTQM